MRFAEKNLAPSSHGLWKALVMMVAVFTSAHAAAQTADAEQRSVLSRSPWTSARGDAMGGALSTLADESDAPYYNPAGIGGLQPKKRNFVRTLHFPFFGVGMNENSMGMYKDLWGKTSDPELAQAVLDANAGKPQYGRVSFVPKLGLGRFLFVYNYDVQMAAVQPTSSSDLIDTHYRVSSGPGVGYSVTTPDEAFSIGAFVNWNTRKETHADIAWADMDDPNRRKSALSGDASTYSAMATNVGFIWKLAKIASPTLAVVARDAADTKYELKSGDGETYLEQQDLTIGFSLSPQLGKWGRLHWLIEGGRLSDDDVSLRKKFRTGLELTFGSRYGGDAALAIRAGYKDAGASYGLGLNIGLIRLEAAQYAEDIGVGNQRVIERRSVGIITINVAEH